MFFKTKCPRCGAKNDKARTACIECGAPLVLEQAEEQLAHVSTEGEMQAKWEAEKAPKERAEDKYRGNEKVLVKARGERKIHRKGWFWTGVGLLIAGVPNWGLAASTMAEKETDVAIVFFIMAVIFTGIGIYCLKRGRKPRAAEEKVGGPILTAQAIEKVEPEPAAAITSPVRNVIVQKFTVMETRSAGQGVSYQGVSYKVEVPCTLIFVEHEGEIPYVLELPLGYSRKQWLGWGIVWIIASVSNWGFFSLVADLVYLVAAIIFASLGAYFMRCARRPRPSESLSRIKFCDKDIYAEWKRTAYYDPLQRIPKKVKSHGRKVRALLPEGSIATAREWAKRIFDVSNLTALECSGRFKPFLRIEPNQIQWFRKRGKPEEIEKAKEVLVSIAERIEKY